MWYRSFSCTQFFERSTALPAHSSNFQFSFRDVIVVNRLLHERHRFEATAVLFQLNTNLDLFNGR